MTTFMLTSRAAVERAWRNLTHGVSFDRHSVWVLLIDAEDRPATRVIEIEDAVLAPLGDEVAPFAEFLAELARHVPAQPCRVAVLRSRPGGGRPTAGDRAWATAMYAAARRAGLPCEVVHFASDDVLVPLPPDDVALSA